MNTVATNDTTRHPSLGPCPDLIGCTASLDGIEWDAAGRAQVVDRDEFVAQHGLPCTHARAAEIVWQDKTGRYSQEWQDRVDEAREERWL